MISISALAADVESLRPVDSEARARTVVSRAYYTAYHGCLSAAGAAGYERKNGAGGTHEQLLRFLGDTSDRKLKAAGKKLKELYRRRVNADYRLYVPVTPQSAGECIENMSEILEILAPVP